MALNGENTLLNVLSMTRFIGLLSFNLSVFHKLYLKGKLQILIQMDRHETLLKQVCEKVSSYAYELQMQYKTKS